MTPEIVLGPPGTGKTTTLLGMVDEELAGGCPPDRVGYVSFTRRAAQEATDRACERFKLEHSSLPYFRTLHSLAFRALGMRRSDVLEGARLAEFGDWIGMAVRGTAGLDDTLLPGSALGDRALFVDNVARICEISLRQAYDLDDRGVAWPLVERCSLGLAEWKRARGLYDYTDMLSMFAAGSSVPRLDALFVDEAQDLSLLQWRAVWRLAQSCRRVVIAGDDDQAIYAWAGAAVDYFVDLPGRVRVLDQSWRVPPQIQTVAQRALAGVRHRREKQWRAATHEGRVTGVRSTAVAEFGGPQDGTVLVLARNFYLLRQTERMLLGDGIPHEVRGRRSVPEALARAVLTWERLRRGETVLTAEAVAAYEYMSAGVKVARGSKTLPRFRDQETATLAQLRERGGLLTEEPWHLAFDRLGDKERGHVLLARRRGEPVTGAPRVSLRTIHGAKGGEADHVIVLTDVAQQTWDEMARRPDEEARVWYVAASRARRRLTLVRPSTRLRAEYLD